MPKVLLSYEASLIADKDLRTICRNIQILVAQAASTTNVTLQEEDVDVLPRINSPHDRVSPVGIEIEAIGYPNRKEKLGQAKVVQELKEKILGIPGFPEVTGPLIWIKFWDPAGLHV